MNINRGAIVCFGYCLGLLLTFLWGGINANPTTLQWLTVCGAIAILTGLVSWILPKHFSQLRPSFFLTTGLVALLAICYFQLRTPCLSNDPIFKLTQAEPTLLKYPVQVVGKVLSQPRQRDISKQSFWFITEKIVTKFDAFPVKNKLYVTLDQVSRPIKPAEDLTLIGRLYKPNLTQNPWSFDFSKYLQKNNAFFGLTSWEIVDAKTPEIGITKIRQRIANVHQKFLSPTQGVLLSSMVLGRKAVNLPESIYDLWAKAGLAYTIAASGFHVSLLLGFTHWFTKKRPKKIQFFIGIIVLCFYILLTGFQPSVLRAALMGTASLLALVLDRAVKPLSLLLVTATILLLYDPLWIWDLGFQLSFLATFGLLTTLEPIQQQLSSFPAAIATAIAIPIAASLWTFPLIAYQFNVISTYSIPLSILLALPITIVSLGGMISGAIGLILPPVGGAIAYVVGFPLSWMIWLVSQVVSFPASNVSIASLHWSQLAIIYGVMLLIWLTDWGKKRYKILGFSLFILFVCFLIAKHYTTTKVTIFATHDQPVIVVQAKGKTLIFDAQQNQSSQFILTAFLRQSGINRINTFIRVNNNKEQNILGADLNIKQDFTLSSHSDISQSKLLAPFQSQRLGNIRFQVLQNKPLLFELKINYQAFYVLGDRRPDDPLSLDILKGYLITNPQNIDLQLWETMRPEKAIAIGSRRDHFLAPNPIVHWTAEDGAIQWTPKQGLISVAPE